MDDSSARFPELFGTTAHAYANADLEFRLGAPSDDLVTRLHLVAIDPDGLIVVCRSAEGWRFLPGGRREEGESLHEVAERELREEAGCALVGASEAVFAHLRVQSHDPEPHRGHFPHPESAWAYAVAHVQAIGPPTNPEDGEVVVEVRRLPVSEAADWLRVHDAEPADVLLLAEAMGLLRT